MLENIIGWAIKARSKQYLNLGSKQGFNLRPSKKAKKYLLYVHVPFCQKLCPYCSFNRYEFQAELVVDYFLSLRKEIKIYHDYGYDVNGVYIGGGTPTILADELFKTIGLLRELYSIEELSVETNPNHLTRENLAALKELKVNRLSVGVQSFNDMILKKIGRYDTYGSGEQLKDKVKQALDSSYVLNVDMIFNFPFQTAQMLEEDLDFLEKLSPDQVTFYPLMPADELYGKNGALSHKKEKQFYFKILDRLSSDWQALSVWCFGKDQGLIDEYIIGRNEYIGAGSGSFGLLNGQFYANTFSPRQYIDRIESGQLPVVFSKQFTNQELLRYGFLMQLFGTTLEIKKFSDEYSADFLKLLAKEIAFLKLAGAISLKNGQIALTRKGMYYWLVAMREFFIGVNNFRQHCRNLNCN